jgi:excisionase family DNA binding protein
MDNPSDLLKIAEVAQLLGVTRRTVYRRIWAGDLPASKIGGLYYIRRSELEALLHSGRRGEQPMTTSESQQAEKVMKCGHCLRLIRSYDQIAGRCVQEGCEALICTTCAAQGVGYCRQHALSPAGKLLDAQEMLAAGEIPLLLKGNDARLREMNFLNRIRTRLGQIDTIIHPQTGELLTIPDWESLLETSDQRAEVMRLKGKVVLDAADLAQTPVNAALTYRIPAQKRQNGAPLEIEVRVISRLEEMVQDGFDIQPMTASELTEQLITLGEQAAGSKVFHLIVLAATTGWDEDARHLIAGQQQGGSAFVHPQMLLYLFDLESSELVFNAGDERLARYVELFIPLLVAEQAVGADDAVEKLMQSRGHGSLSLADAVKSLPYDERVLRHTFGRMQASGRYNLVEMPDLGLVIVEK